MDEQKRSPYYLHLSEEVFNIIRKETGANSICVIVTHDTTPCNPEKNGGQCLGHQALLSTEGIQPEYLPGFLAQSVKQVIEEQGGEMDITIDEIE